MELQDLVRVLILQFFRKKDNIILKLELKIEFWQVQVFLNFLQIYVVFTMQLEGNRVWFFCIYYMLILIVGIRKIQKYLFFFVFYKRYRVFQELLIFFCFCFEVGFIFDVQLFCLGLFFIIFSIGRMFFVVEFNSCGCCLRVRSDKGRY